jgi:hypothetical protein
MNKEQLKNLLKAKQIPDYFYNLDAVGETDQRVCLEFNMQGWVVYYSERGKKFDLMSFSTEDEACQEVLNRFTN